VHRRRRGPGDGFEIGLRNVSALHRDDVQREQKQRACAEPCLPPAEVQSVTSNSCTRRPSAR
jgi:hypothetical protein